MYFALADLINRDIAQLYPVSTEGTAKSYNDSNMIVKRANVAHGCTANNLELVYHKKDMFYIGFPWLYNAKTQDYIEICDSNPAAFDFFAHSIGKIARVSNGIDSNINDTVFNDVQDALKEIQSAFEKRKAYLKKKGVVTAVGIALTFIPFALTKVFDNFNPDLFSAFLGGSTIHSGHELVS